MLRTQIQLTEDQDRRLRAMARRQGVSLAEMIRRSVDAMLAREMSKPEDRYARAATLIGAAQDGDAVTDLAHEHDRYLGQAFE